MATVDLSGAKTGQSLEQRLARLEDVEAIRNLKALYASYCDHGYDPDGVASLFTKDGVWESNAFGTYRGVDKIHRFMAGISKMVVWALHYMTNPMIDVAPDGQSASASWLLFGLATMLRPDDPSVRDAVVQTGNYEDTLVKEDGVWKFRHLKVHLHFVSNLDHGWVKQPFRP